MGDKNKCPNVNLREEDDKCACPAIGKFQYRMYLRREVSTERRTGFSLDYENDEGIMRPL